MARVHTSRTHASRVLARGLTTGLILALILTLGPTSGAFAQADKPAKLTKADRELVIAANGETVVLLIASKPRANGSVASAVSALGGVIRYREDSVDYLRVRIGADLADDVSRIPGVESVEVDAVIPIEDPTPDGVRPAVPMPPPNATTPNNNPYMPIGEIGASQFMAANPGWDGRGVTIGIIDSGVSLDHPSLLTTSTGERKVIGWTTGTDPFDDNDPTWLAMNDQVRGPTFVYQGISYTAPGSATYRIAVFNERDARLGGEVGSDVNRDGNPAGSSGLFAVLWDTATNDVYVDTDQDRSFADELAMTDYNVRFDVGTFGTDNPATAIREAMPFVVQTDGKNKAVNIGIVSSAHGSHVAGIAAGHSLFGGAMSGAAPGAKIVSVRACLFVAGCTSHALVEGMIYLAKNAGVDVINMSIGGLPSLNDGNNTRARIYDRLIEQSNVQMFISAGNSGPGINTVGDPSVATKVMSVGSYVSNLGYQFNYGADSFPHTDNLHHFTSRGPREDGGFKPQIVAPGHAISTIPLWQAGGCLTAPNCPPGYALFNGTSMASPASAGAAALLINAANATGAQKQPAQLRQAINSSARYLDVNRHQAYDQGNGLINVGTAWDLLKTNIKTVDITSSVPVNTVLSGFLATPGVGVGIYDREGVTAGTSYTRTYTFTRTSGGGGSQTFNLSWVGNDGTFSTAGSISLPKNAPVTLAVNVNPATSGAHSAILNLDDPTTAGIDYQTMNTVLAADQFTAANNYRIVKSSTISRSTVHHYFVNVPAGTPALKVDFSGPTTGPGTGQLRFLRWHPYGVGIDSNAVSNCYLPTPGCPAPGGAAAAASRTTSNPQAGVWEITVDARRSSDSDNAAYTLTISILGASVSPNPDVIASATIGVPVSRSYTLTNLYGAFTGRAVGTTLGSAHRATPTIANLEVQEYPITVTAGSTSLRATIGGTSDPAADLDLFVYNCTTGTCVLAGQNADGDSEESVTITNPAAGNWKVVVDGFAVPAGTTTYNYIDVFTNTAFGSISVTDANALRAAGSSWTVPGSVTANAVPAAGRVLYGNVQVRTDGNVLVGSGDVIVEAVTP